MSLTPLPGRRGNMAEQPEDSTVTEESRDESVSRLAWFLTGAIIGATVAILYAPKAGKDTRKYLSDRAHAGKDAVTDTTTDIVESGREMFERGRKMVDDAAALFDRARKMVQGD
ncbi:MAG TPA: YtxH domain-containing protein [Bryobacteraceae bacterium]|nr:YtxH domain-containing protein [Bryobacteraceae bacterium]